MQSILEEIMHALGWQRIQPPAPPAPPFDVEQALIDMAAQKNMGNLNYDNSIVDLLKLLGLPTDMAYRQRLAAELQCQVDPADEAAFNAKLHELVMVKLAEDGAVVPDAWKGDAP